MEQAKVRMAIDPFEIMDRALSNIRRRIPTQKAIGIDYDEEADILYIRFKHAKAVDNEPLDKDGYILASLDENQQIVGISIMDVSSLAGGPQRYLEEQEG